MDSRSGGKNLDLNFFETVYLLLYYNIIFRHLEARRSIKNTPLEMFQKQHEI